MQSVVEKILIQAIEACFSVHLESIKLEVPPKKELGDFAFTCFMLAKQTKLAPPLIAQTLQKFIVDNGYKEFTQVQVAGPYLNIFLNPQIYTDTFLQEFVTGLPQFAQKDELVIVDYIGANVGKPLHIGHMCTPNIGQVLVNVHKRLGYKVISDSHIGDWGIIFGKLILAYKLWGDEKKLETDAINYLLELYIKISGEAENNQQIEQQTRDEFKLLSQGNPESIKLWESITRQSIDFMQIQLDRLAVHPDYHIGESFYEGLDIPKMGNYPDLKFSMKKIVKELVDAGIAIQNEDGSVGVEFEKMPSTILQKKDGTHGYLASDLATIKYRVENSKQNLTDKDGKNWGGLKKILYSVDIRQELHLQQVFDIAHRAGWVENIELFHAANGFISLKEGAMSTRTGNIIRLEALLDEAESRAEKIILEKRQDIQGDELDTLSKIIGISAIKYGYLKNNRLSNVVFDWDEFMSFEGNSGPYIQYALVRAKSILESIENSQELSKITVGYTQVEEIELIKMLLGYSQILQETATKCFPHILAGYAYELTKAFNTFYNAVNIKHEPNLETQALRLFLVRCFTQVLSDAFAVLGISVPEKM